MTEAVKTYHPELEAIFQSAKAAPILVTNEEFGETFVLTRARFDEMVACARIDAPKTVGIPRADGENLVIVKSDDYVALIDVLMTVRPITSSDEITKAFDI